MVRQPMSAIPPLLYPLLKWAAFAIALGCAAAALLGQAGRWNGGLDVLNHFEPIWLFGAVLAAVVWLAIGRTGWLIPALASLAVMIALVQIGPELMARRPRAAVAPGAETLKIIQFNLWHNNVDRQATLRWLLAQNADVVILEEALGNAEIVHNLKSVYPYRRTCAGLTYCEIEIFSKRAPLSNGGLIDELGIPAAWVIYPGSGGPFAVMGTHAVWPLPAAPQQWQSATLAKVLDHLPKDRMIVAGDFNSTPWSFALRRQDRLFGLQRLTHGLASFPARAYPKLNLKAPFPFLPIDQVYAGKGWRTISVQRGPRLGSDHYPVIVTLQAVGARAG